MFRHGFYVRLFDGIFHTPSEIFVFGEIIRMDTNECLSVYVHAPDRSRTMYILSMHIIII